MMNLIYRTFSFLLPFILLGVNLYGESLKPNVVIIYGDDIGYGDVSAYGAEKLKTPFIDSLAKTGLRFTDAHSTASTCSPSRFSMLIGEYAFRNNIWILGPKAPLVIPTDSFTLADLFKTAGYRTSIIGKWHLGLGTKDNQADWNGRIEPGPLELGFDYAFFIPSTNDRVPCVYVENRSVVNLDPEDPISVGLYKSQVDSNNTQYPDGKTNRSAMTYYESSHGHNHSVINGIGRIGYMSGGKSALWNDETMADVFVEKASAFIESNKNKPFFMFFSSQDIHVPRTPHPRFHGVTELGYRGDAMIQFDWTVGSIVKALKEHNLFENTIVIVTSDNGPAYDDGYQDGTTIKTSKSDNDRGHYAAGEFRGGKYSIYEGGNRVPMIIHWPEKIKPGISKALISQIDFINSFASLLNIEIPKNSARDSIDGLKALLGKDAKGRAFLVEESPRAIALRKRNWKYIEFNETKENQRISELYDLKKDPSETLNLINKYPIIAENLKQELESVKNSNQEIH